MKYQYTIFFFSKNIVFFPVQAEYSYFSVDVRLKILLRIFLDYNHRTVMLVQVFIVLLASFNLLFRERKNFIRFS